MTALFLKIMEMSVSASLLIAAVLICRPLLRKAPRWISVLLWGIVAVRLLCPFSVESAFSLIPDPVGNGEFISERLNEAAAAKYDGLGEAFTAESALIPALTAAWISGMAFLALYTAASYIRLRRSVSTAVLLRDNVFQSENVSSPFVLGLAEPKIYLPFEEMGVDMAHVIAHEEAHILRRDHWWKALGFVLAAVHWFNPLVWTAYILLCRDVELACDERVIKELDSGQRADYTQALLSCSTGRRRIAVCPLAFGEVGVKERVEAVMKYRKPAVRAVIAAVVVCAVLAVCFLTDPKTIDAPLAVFIDCEIANHHQSPYSAENFCCVDWEVLGAKKKGDEITVYMWVLYTEYSYDNGLKEETGAHIPTAITVKKESDNGYSPVEYWEPRDGSYYAKDIRDKFPWYLYFAAVDSQRYIESQTAACERAAMEHFGLI